MSKILESY